MNYNFFVVGGDLRIYNLAKQLKQDGHKVKILGFDKIPIQDLQDENFEIAKSMQEKEENDIIISSIPFTTDGENVYAPFSTKEIKITNLKNNYIIAGKLPDGLNGYDLLSDEEMTIMNTIATAEGTIAKTIEEIDINLDGANAMVLGFGRVGKMMAYKLKNNGANVFVEARKEKDLAWIKAFGYTAVPLENLNNTLCKQDVVYNTIPHIILDKNKLLLMSKNTLIIDLASKPYGVDFKTAEKLGIKAFAYSGIPGKVSPKSSAEIIKNAIYKLIQEKEKK